MPTDELLRTVIIAELRSIARDLGEQRISPSEASEALARTLSTLAQLIAEEASEE